MARALNLSLGNRGARGGAWIRILIAVGVAIFALISYFGSSEYNPVTEEKQYLSLTPKQEIALGLQAAPQAPAEDGLLGATPEPLPVGLARGGAVQGVQQRQVDGRDHGRASGPFSFSFRGGGPL